MKFFNTTKKKVVAGAVAAAVLAGSGIAGAYWSTSGSGSGTSDTTAGISDTLAFDTSDINAMFPGDDEQTFTVNVENTHASESGWVATVKAYITVEDSVGAPVTGCDGDDFLLNGVNTAVDETSAIALGWTAQELAAGGDADTDGTDTIHFNNKPTTNQDACKDVVVRLNYLAS